MSSDILEKYAPDEEAADWLQREVQSSCLCNPATLRSSYALAKYVVSKNIPGRLVECGTFAGGQVAAMYRATRDAHGLRFFDLFDSFEGIPHASDKDTDNIDSTLFSHGKDGALKTSGISACSAAAVRGNLGRWGVPFASYCTHEGWFQDTVPLFHRTEIALLRLDGDLYESTKACWPLLDLVVPGGVVIIDDWALQGCRRAVEEWLAEAGETPEIIEIPEGGGPVFYLKGVIP